MRKLLLSALAFTFVAGMAVSSFAASGTTSIQWDITVQFSAFDIDIVSDSPDPLSYGIVANSINILSNNTSGQNRITLHNDGYATIDYTAAVACANPNTWTATTPWTVGSSLGDNLLANNTFVLAGIFTAPVIASEQAAPYGRDLAVSDFANNDVLTGVANVASATNLYWEGGTDPIWMSGDAVSVVPTGDTQRSMRFLLQTPQALDAGISISVLLQVTIGAQLDT